MALFNRIQSPLATLIPFIPAEEAAKMAYPPNALPGARNVETFYGAMRVYEWGPEDGSKVLFVHGDATPCLIFSKIAQGLVDAGHRVMLFDLWGRGYSDTPLDCRHDVRLFATQILMALTSSSLSWIGNENKFSIVAFSLGAPISLAFAGAFPASIRSMVLLAPAGLIRKLPKDYEDLFIHQPDVAPSQESVREKVRQILGVAPSGPTSGVQLDQHPVVSPESLEGVYLGSSERGRGPSRVQRDFDMEGILQWQFDHHRGHIHSFQDTVRYGPLQRTGDLWRKVCDIIAGRTRIDTPLHESKLLVFFGRNDDVVVGEETTEDILKLLPPSHLQIEYLPGGHGFPYPSSREITQCLLSFWSLTTVKLSNI
ncbi:Alpha/Beta hydrolase protein [Hypoxylon sp. FL0543]|nr:Alpha/Beta hydrolase protein [Hypoxylon sp. FL0543]